MLTASQQQFLIQRMERDRCGASTICNLYYDTQDWRGTALNFGQKPSAERTWKIALPENPDCDGLFDGLLQFSGRFAILHSISKDAQVRKHEIADCGR